MNAAIRIAGVTSGVAWGLCLVVMLVLIDRTPVQLSVAALAFIGVPFAFFSDSVLVGVLRSPSPAQAHLRV